MGELSDAAWQPTELLCFEDKAQIAHLRTRHVKVEKSSKMSACTVNNHEEGGTRKMCNAGSSPWGHIEKFTAVIGNYCSEDSFCVPEWARGPSREQKNVDIEMTFFSFF